MRLPAPSSRRTQMLHARPGETDASWASDSRFQRHGIARTAKTFLVILRGRDANLRDTGPNRLHKRLRAANVGRALVKVRSQPQEHWAVDPTQRAMPRRSLAADEVYIDIGESRGERLQLGAESDVVRRPIAVNETDVMTRCPVG